MIRRLLAFLFLILSAISFYHCGRKGTPTGGIKDIIPPKLVKAEPAQLTTNFESKKIRLYFDEFIKLKDVQEQLIISPPLKNTPIISPQGTTNKYVEIILKDTLKENTTYTFNFGQSIIDNNEGNPNRFFTYVFSTGDYIDSLQLKGVVEDAFDKEAEDFISVMLYELDSTYTDSTIYKKPPTYITNTLDSTVFFTLDFLKKGQYALFALKDNNKNNLFDPDLDKIAFSKDTITLPTEETYLLTLFKEKPAYAVSVPKYEAKNKIIFGYQGDGKDIVIENLTILPDSVQTIINKEREKDTLNYWITPFKADSLVFTITNSRLKLKDTFVLKTRKLPLDSLVLKPSTTGVIGFEEKFKIAVNTPIIKTDASQMGLINKDSLAIAFTATLDSLDNSLQISFEKEQDQVYKLAVYPSLIEDFFGNTNDTVVYTLTTKKYSDYGSLELSLSGSIIYPAIIQLTDEKGEKIVRELYATEPKDFKFNYIDPGKYAVRVIFDGNKNKQWDTGDYLNGIQPERVSYAPKPIEMRANWEEKYNFILLN